MVTSPGTGPLRTWKEGWIGENTTRGIDHRERTNGGRKKDKTRSGTESIRSYLQTMERLKVEFIQN